MTRIALAACLLLAIVVPVSTVPATAEFAPRTDTEELAQNKRKKDCRPVRCTTGKDGKSSDCPHRCTYY